MNNYINIGFLFDLDGVLIDSEREYSRIWSQINKEYPTQVESLEQIIKGCTLDKILNDFYPDMKIRTKVIERLYELESNMHYDYKPGAKNLLISIKDKKIPIALVTSSDDKKMDHLNEELPDLIPMFDFIVTANLITKSKPNPEGYLLGAEKLGLNPNNCVVFEDSLQGVIAGKNAGAYVVGVAGTLPREALMPFSAIVIDSLEEIYIQDLFEIIKHKKNKMYTTSF